jgi:hypothetical protein
LENESTPEIKVFMWFLHRKVILTKDNLARRNWNGDESCCFCDNKESIQHLFFECPLAKIIWRIIHMTFGLAPPKNVSHRFGNWLKGIPKNDLVQIRLGVCAVIWAIWNNRNDHVFNKPKKHSFLQVIPMATIGSVCGPISNKRSSGKRRIMCATGWRR